MERGAIRNEWRCEVRRAVVGPGQEIGSSGAKSSETTKWGEVGEAGWGGVKRRYLERHAARRAGVR